MGNAPLQARAMDKSDIRNYRRWHLEAVKRARRAGYDIVCCYAGHNLSIAGMFMLERYNFRSDEYGGCLENRVRLFREIIEDAKDAVGDTMGVVVRFAVDELRGPDGLEWHREGREIVALLAELPDLWDVNVAEWENDSVSSRFSEEGFQEPFVSFVKTVTTKPVVGVGRYTSPDRMAAIVNRGIVDMIGAARPSIADPFLPRKIQEGRTEDIRECIGCNICVAWSQKAAPMRCTQNPTMGEEWRRGWHPERMSGKRLDGRVLVVGAGPAGLEAARAAGQRGCEVILAEASHEPGGRVSAESRLPGLSAWGRVRDYRVYQISKMGNVQLYPANALTAKDVLDAGAAHVAIATGSSWRRDGYGRTHQLPIPGTQGPHVFTPDDVMSGSRPAGPVLIYDDDHYYLGGVIAELLAGEGRRVALATPQPVASAWAEYTLEQHRIQARLMELGVDIIASHSLEEIAEEHARLACVFTGRTRDVPIASVVMLTSRLPQDSLYHELASDAQRLADAGITTLRRIGDCYGPGTIAAAVYEGHRFVRELGGENADIPFEREVSALAGAFRLP
jgi:dimethylamine/trimethylamine dehydrogenase